MSTAAVPWDFLIVTASNQHQADAYREQLKHRADMGMIPGVEEILVVPDPRGIRIGSGGGTLFGLVRALNHLQTDNWHEALNRLRILIVHAGGDSQRLPPYSSCGKLLIPVPGESEHIFGGTLFDIQLPSYLSLPPLSNGKGQVVVATGDVYLDFDASRVHFSDSGITAVGCPSAPEIARNHGVFCPGKNGRVNKFLQKPSIELQNKMGAVNRFRQSLLDIGIWSLTAESSSKLLMLCGIRRGQSGKWELSGDVAESILSHGLDLYREIGCALADKTDFNEYLSFIEQTGSKDNPVLRKLFEAVNPVPFFLQTVARCTFLHFGTPRQLMESGYELKKRTDNFPSADSPLIMNSVLKEDSEIIGKRAWIEGCRINAKVVLEGENLLTGAEIDEPLTLEKGCCLDIIAGKNRGDGRTWFFRISHLDDQLKASRGHARYCRLHFDEWMRLMGAGDVDLWEVGEDQKFWNARIFPAMKNPQEYTQWMWIYSPDKYSRRNREAWKHADRYSLKDILDRTDQAAFHTRRILHHIETLFEIKSWLFRQSSRFSSRELSYVFSLLDEEGRAKWIGGILSESCRQWEEEEEIWGIERLEFSRTIHSLAQAVSQAAINQSETWHRIFSLVRKELTCEQLKRLSDLNIGIGVKTEPEDWAGRGKNAAFENLSRTIILSSGIRRPFPKKALRSDEIVWGRAPARLDIGGGWTDTPPYALENGGCVINTAVDLNGQAPIHVYGRLTEEKVIRISSIDHGVNIVIKELPELMNYREASGKFGLAKAALALAGFSSANPNRPGKAETLEKMLDEFGGGIELTTLAAIPSGSGLGTSSIMGAVLVSVIARMAGEKLSQRDLFHRVLQLEQELTTGGGWQDQIGGSLPGLKMITSGPGLVPDPKVEYITGDLLDPRRNGGSTLLYYTGMRRLAKNILRNVVGRYLDRDHAAMQTLRELHAYPPLAAAALSQFDLKSFGELIDYAWRLNKRIDPESTNQDIEDILTEFRPFMYGAKLLGAGGGGFLLVVCRSPESADEARARMEKHPPNQLARFFEYQVSPRGLEVTVC